MRTGTEWSGICRNSAEPRDKVNNPRLEWGGLLVHHEARISYAVIRHNIRTYVSGGVVQVIRGQQNAARAVAQFEGSQTSDDRHDGWRYFLEETQLTPGMDPEQATRQRWLEFDAREAKAMQLNCESARRRLYPTFPRLRNKL
jgi:hypothetical protein